MILCCMVLPNVCCLMAVGWWLWCRLWCWSLRVPVLLFGSLCVVVCCWLLCDVVVVCCMLCVISCCLLALRVVVRLYVLSR